MTNFECPSYWKQAASLRDARNSDGKNSDVRQTRESSAPLSCSAPAQIRGARFGAANAVRKNPPARTRDPIAAVHPLQDCDKPP